MVSAVHQRVGGQGTPSRQRLYPRRVESSRTLLRAPQISHLPPILRLFLAKQTAGLFRSRHWKFVAVGTAPEQTQRHVCHILLRVPTETCRNALPPVNTPSVRPRGTISYWKLFSSFLGTFQLSSQSDTLHESLRAFLRSSRAEMTKYSSKR